MNLVHDTGSTLISLVDGHHERYSPTLGTPAKERAEEKMAAHHQRWAISLEKPLGDDPTPQALVAYVREHLLADVWRAPSNLQSLLISQLAERGML